MPAETYRQPGKFGRPETPALGEQLRTLDEVTSLSSVVMQHFSNRSQTERNDAGKAT